MNRTVLYILIFLVGGLLSSRCSRPTVYGIGNVGTEGKYIPKPEYKDTVTSEFYVSGQYYHGEESGYNSNEESFFGDFVIARSITHEKFNYAYGVTGFYGEYHAAGVRYPENHGTNFIHDGIKDFYGGGLMGEFNVLMKNIFTIPGLFGFKEKKYIGIRANIFYEAGDYRLYRMRIRSLSPNYYDIHQQRPMMNLSLTSDYSFELKKVHLGLFTAFGATFPGESPLININIAPYLKIHRWSVYAQVNFGISWTHSRDIGNYSLGINYRIYE